MASKPIERVRESLVAIVGNVISYSKIPHVPVLLDSSYVAACALYHTLDSKLVEQTAVDAKEKAISLFLGMNDRCARDMNFDTSLVRRMRLLSERDLYDVSFDEILDFDHLVGPGASVGSKGNNSLYEKLFTNSITYTREGIRDHFTRVAGLDPAWHSALTAQSDFGGFTHVLGSVTSTVPKSTSIDRTICTEPTLNMAYQLGYGRWLDRQMRRLFGYANDLQPDRNRRMACVGSLSGDYATIDLSSASDTISLSLLESILPSYHVELIRYLRSPSTIIDGQRVKLHMVSSMGNGFTFSLQTYIFSLMIRALCVEHSERFIRYERELGFGVFGDDIVVPRDMYDLTIEGLISLGFIPNESKSFNHGFFRESCGTDWYNGVNVRGVYIKSLKTEQDYYSAFNRISRFAAVFRFPLDLSGFLRYRVAAVPTWESDDSGLKTPYHPVSHQVGCSVYMYKKVVTYRKPIQVISKSGVPLKHVNVSGFIKYAVKTGADLGGYR
jgi:hypothetical protein